MSLMFSGQGTQMRRALHRSPICAALQRNMVQKLFLAEKQSPPEALQTTLLA